jgi:hypothetical protein
VQWHLNKLRTGFGAVVLVSILTVTSCGFNCASGGEPTVRKLISGRELKILGLDRHSTVHVVGNKRELQMVLRYETAVSLDRRDLLRQEAEEIWPELRADAEREQATHVSLRAQTPVKRIGVFSKQRGFAFPISRRLNGTWSLNDWGRDYDSELDAIARDFFHHAERAEWDEAARTFAYPKHFSADQVEKEASSLSGALATLAEEFGGIKSRSEAREAVAPKLLWLSTGDEAYWARYPHLVAQIYDVVFTQAGRGCVVVCAPVVDGKLVLGRVAYGVPSNHRRAVEVLDAAFARLKGMKDDSQ